jgi:hypothetical protein
VKCKSCEENCRPNKGSPFPGYCDACGFAIVSKTGERVCVAPEVEAVVVLGEALAGRQSAACTCFGASDGYHDSTCPTWKRERS